MNQEPEASSQDTASPQDTATHARMKPRRKRPWESTFLKVLSTAGIWQRACDAVELDRNTVYEHAERHPDFAAAVEAAKQTATDKLEAEAHRRAFEGIERKRFTSKGEPIIDPATGQHYIEREYSDKLIEFLLCAHGPKRFRRASDVELAGSVKITIDRGALWRP